MHNRQFYIYKFKSSRLKEFKYNINISFDEAKELKEIVAIADNQILRSIRDIRKRTINNLHLERLYKERDLRKRINRNINSCNDKENSNRIKKIQDRINRTMFIPDYITIVMDHPSHYKTMFENGVIINNKVYRRLSCSASQARVSTVSFCCEDILDELNRRLNNGRDLNKKISPSKFNAYFGLYGSSTQVVSEPKFIVVKDFINTDTFDVNYVTETDWDLDDKIDVKTVTLKMNRTDGMGLISPRQAKKWADELNLDYIPSQFCIRQSFIKGMLCVFDIHKFCEEVNNNNYIVDTIYKDENGNYIKADLREYDVIITESQFKLWDSFPNIETYIDNCRKNKLYWGISQYTPKEPKDILKLNYQFIQTLNLNEEDVKNLARQFVDWISGVSYDNIYYTLLFLLGVNNNKHTILNYLKNSDNYWIKSLIVNNKIKSDKYIKNKIKELLKVRIQNACMGEIFVDGNFQVLVYDPYAFMQHVCGLEVTGLLKKGEFYSNYWNERNVTKINGMRSPLTYRSEHVNMNLIKNEETEKWYKYCKLGIILNYHGHEVVNFGGADVDYDILATTSNPYIINNIYKDELPVYYDPPTPQKIVCTDRDLFNADLFSFGSIIGSITNKSSNAYALLPNIENEYGKDSDEYKILISRLKQCCKAQSAQIDKAKIGREVKGIPKIWITKQKDKGLEMYNRILLNKYPYFFKYLYKEAKKKFNKYCEENDITCHQKFKMSFNKLKELDRKSLEQQEFIDNYYKYMPLTYSDSPMNLLCRYIESINFEINKKIKNDDNEDFIELYKNHNYNYTEEQYNQIISEFKKYIKNIKFNKLLLINDNENNHFNEDILSEYKIDNELLEEKLNRICSNVYIVVNCLIDYCYHIKPSVNKDILWSTYGEYIFENVKQNTSEKCKFPLPNKNGDIEYLNKRYKLEVIDI